MALTLSEIQDCFKNIGKMVHISQTATSQAAVLKTSVMGAVDQSTTGSASEYPMFQKVVKGLNDSMYSTISTLEKVADTMKASTKTYLQQVVAVNLGLAAGATLPAIEAELTSQMNSVSARLDASGTNGSNDDGLAMYMYDNFDLDLPNGGTVNCPDTYITATVV